MFFKNELMLSINTMNIKLMFMLLCIGLPTYINGIFLFAFRYYFQCDNIKCPGTVIPIYMVMLAIALHMMALISCISDWLSRKYEMIIILPCIITQPSPVAIFLFVMDGPKILVWILSIFASMVNIILTIIVADGAEKWIIQKGYN